MPPPRPAPTHFLSLPLAGPQLARSWAAFRADATSPAGGALPADAVRPLGTLHLTLGVMSLGPEGVAAAARVLDGLRPHAMLAELRAALPPSSPPSGLAVTLRGLRAMQAPSRAAVLYAAPHDPDGLLQRFCEELRRPFCDAGLVLPEPARRPLLLHATLVNTRHAGRAAGRRRATVDAADLLRRYDDFLWADALPVTRLAVCRMGAKPVAGGPAGDAAYEVELETALV